MAICLDRGTDMVSALLGILKSGAAYVPLDPAYPTDRLAYMIEDSGAPLIVTRPTHVDRLPAATPRLLLEDWPEELPRVPVARPRRRQDLTIWPT